MICEAGSKRLDGDANILERAVRMCTSISFKYIIQFSYIL